ncbi:formate efflux transporter [Vibrio maritimus]|uniref:Formate efflux transporter n=1 Tax=Vibrio maritimus TaxID=990268 RepID=A0A090RVD8_9VIBR|nr:formate efflux transporter [Vibrio maritimus]
MVQAFALGVLCNLLVCLAIWLTFSSANAMTKAAMTVLPVAMFVSSGFEHCVANMFMVPLGIVIQNFAGAEFWAATGTTQAQFSDLTPIHFLTNNLIPVTLGNIIGGSVLVGLANWSIYRRPQLKAANVTAITQTTELTSVKETQMNNNIIVKDIMNTQPVTLSVEMPTAVALDTLLDHNLTSAPVTDIEGRLVGFFSVHDVMVDLWCQDYIPEQGQKVVDLMSRDVVAINASEKLVDVAEFLCIDKEQLYPVSSMGIATSFSTLSLEERAKAMKVNKPHVLPVLENGVLVGILSRAEVMKAVRPIYGERLNVVERELESA